MPGRFDYVKYDDESTSTQQQFKAACEGLTALIESRLKPGRARSLAITALEVAYMWIGKAIRDEQVERGSQPENIDERSNE